MNFIQDAPSIRLASGSLPLFAGSSVSALAGQASVTTTAGARGMTVFLRGPVPMGHDEGATEGSHEQRLQEVGIQAAKIAHDLNNLLSPILMALEIFRTELPDASHQKMLEIAKKSTLRAAALAKQILSFASGTEEETRTQIQAGEIIDEIATIARRTFPKSLKIEVDIAPDLAPITANGTQLHQSLLNLCINARDAMPEGGTLSLRATNIQLDGPETIGPRALRPGAYVLLEVSDTGTGIPEAIREKIFEPFFTTKGPSQGTGLGLASVRSIVESHAGVLSLHTAAGKGTTFHLLLPASPAQTPAHAR